MSYTDNATQNKLKELVIIKGKESYQIKVVSVERHTQHDKHTKVEARQ